VESIFIPALSRQESGTSLSSMIQRSSNTGRSQLLVVDRLDELKRANRSRRVDRDLCRSGKRLGNHPQRSMWSIM
jgi:hypothetical protein